MAKIYDTGDINFDDGGAVIAQNEWSDLEEVTINDHGCKIVKIILECVTSGSVTGNVHIFSETNASWANDGAATQAPVGTTGHMVTYAFTEATITDTAYYFANNDTTNEKTLYIAVRNTDATSGKFKIRILYETLSVDYET